MHRQAKAWMRILLSKYLPRALAVLISASIFVVAIQILLLTGTGRECNGDGVQQSESRQEQTPAAAAVKSRGYGLAVPSRPALAAFDDRFDDYDYHHDGQGVGPVPPPPPAIGDGHSLTVSEPVADLDNPAWLGTQLEASFRQAVPYTDSERASYCLRRVERAVPPAAAALGLVVVDAGTVLCLAGRGPPPQGAGSPGDGSFGPPAPVGRTSDSEPTAEDGDSVEDYVRLGVSDDSFDRAADAFTGHPGLVLVDADSDNVLVRSHGLHVLLSRIVQPVANGSDYWIYAESKLRRLRLPALAALRPLLWRVAIVQSGGLYAPLDGSFYAWQLARGRYLTCDTALAQELERIEWTEEIRNMSRDATYRPDHNWIEGTALLRDLMYDIRVPVMLAMGTLLGWYRNCGWIPYTTDVDLGFFGDDFTPEIERVLRDSPAFYLQHIFGLPWEAYEITVMYRRSHNTDLFAYYNEGNMTWVGTTSNSHPADLPKYRWYLPRIGSSLCTGALHGRLFFVPCDVTSYLASHYGATWRRPDGNHGVAQYYRFNGHWPNATRHLTERKRFIVCWNGGTERLATGGGDACDCAPGYTGRFCMMRVPPLAPITSDRGTVRPAATTRRVGPPVPKPPAWQPKVEI